MTGPISLGTGFLIYGDATSNSGYWEIWIDSDPNSTPSVNPNDIKGFSEMIPGAHAGQRRPMALGVVNNSAVMSQLSPATIVIGPGIHFVRLKAHVGSFETVTFDGVRIFP